MLGSEVVFLQLLSVGRDLSKLSQEQELSFKEGVVYDVSRFVRDAISSEHWDKRHRGNSGENKQFGGLRV
jgi:hypothetical protein